MLILAAAALGFIYTAATEKGVFARPSPSKPAKFGGGQAPAMIMHDEALNLFQAGTAVFIDARHEFDFKLGHIKGAISLPLKDYDTKKTVLSAISKDRLIVAYCDGADCNSSIELSVKLWTDGYRNVKIFFGGWREWGTANLPTEKSP